MNIDTFFTEFRAHFGVLTQQQVDGLNALLTAMAQDNTSTLTQAIQTQHLAYEFATIFHETAHTMQPIEEYGKGRGRSYGVPDATTGQTYYGRGYVQLTWRTNYEKFGTLLGIDLLNHPELALEPATAYKIMSTGMEQGLFTGKKLSDYDGTNGAFDYYNARRIINGLDRADLIRGYATMFEEILNAAQEAA